MATFVYDTAYEEALDGGLDWTAGDFLVILAAAGPLDPAAVTRDDLTGCSPPHRSPGWRSSPGSGRRRRRVGAGVTAAETVERVFICRDTGSASRHPDLGDQRHTDSPDPPGERRQPHRRVVVERRRPDLPDLMAAPEFPST